MKRLILTRHAKSSWDDPLTPDHDRDLNDRGKAAAADLGRRTRRRRPCRHQGTPPAPPSPDAHAAADVPAWARMRGHTVESVDNDADGQVRAVVVTS